MKLLLSLLASVLSFSVMSFGAEERVVVKGSNTLGASLVPRLAEAYRATGKKVRFSISAEGSATAFPALAAGKADIGASSRAMTAQEAALFHGSSAGLKQTVLCLDGIAVVVNGANPLKGLTKAQVRQILTGDIRDWSAVGGAKGPISVFTRNAVSGTGLELQRMAMAQRAYAPGSRVLPTNEKVAEQVGRTPGGIGYVSLAFTHHAGTKVVPVGGVFPSEKAVRGGSYPYRREVYLFTTKNAPAAAKDFVAFCTGTAAQKVVRDAGFVPVK